MEFIDHKGRKIKLSEERIKHIGYHMSLSDKLYLVEEILKHPDIISLDSERNYIFYYQKYLKNKGLYFIIVVKNLNGEGFIITAFESKKLKLT